MRSLISLLQFATVLPLGKMQDLESFARRSYLYPIAGYVIGLLGAIPVYFIADRMVAAAVAIAIVLILSGAHHFDGLLDFGDGLMAHGDQKKRIHALTDRQVGAGGITAGLATTLLLFSGLQASASIVSAIIIGEVCAKFSMAFLTTYGIPFREGMHSYLHQFAHPYFPFISILLCMPLILLPVRTEALVVAGFFMILCPLILLTISNKIFGGVNGDVVGASNEITRAVVIVAMVLI